MYGWGVVVWCYGVVDCDKNLVAMALMLHLLYVVRLAFLPYTYFEIRKVLGGKKEEEEPEPGAH